MSDNIKDLTKEELVKLLKKKEEEIHYLSEDINNKEIEISNLKEAHEKELNEKITVLTMQKDSAIEELRKEKDKDLKTNLDNAQNVIDNQNKYINRRENELNESINLLNNVVTCVESFAAICKYANGEVIKKITKEN